MALNPQYDAIGKGFVQQYYTLFDDPAQRQNLVNMYNVSIEIYVNIVFIIEFTVLITILSLTSGIILIISIFRLAII